MRHEGGNTGKILMRSAERHESASESILKPTEKKSSQDNVPAIVRNLPVSAKKSTLIVSEESHGEVLEPLSLRMSEEISQSVNLLNSSTTVLSSQLKRLGKQMDQSEHLDIGASLASAATAKGIADLIKTKCQMMKLQLDINVSKRRKRASRRK